MQNSTGFIFCILVIYMHSPLCWCSAVAAKNHNISKWKKMSLAPFLCFLVLAHRSSALKPTLPSPLRALASRSCQRATQDCASGGPIGSGAGQQAFAWRQQRGSGRSSPGRQLLFIWNPDEVYSRYIPRIYHVYSERRYIRGIYLLCTLELEILFSWIYVQCNAVNQCHGWGQSNVEARNV